MSQGSEMSYKSIRSSGLAGGNAVSNTLERVRKMKRPTSFDSSRLQIKVAAAAAAGGAKKQPEAAKRTTRSRLTRKTPVKKGPNTAAACNRAKRNLTFDDEPGRPPVRRSPRKRLRSDSGDNGGEKTPSKKRARIQVEFPYSNNLSSTSSS